MQLYTRSNFGNYLSLVRLTDNIAALIWVGPTLAQSTSVFPSSLNTESRHQNNHSSKVFNTMTNTTLNPPNRNVITEKKKLVVEAKSWARSKKDLGVGRGCGCHLELGRFQIMTVSDEPIAGKTMNDCVDSFNGVTKLSNWLSHSSVLIFTCMIVITFCQSPPDGIQFSQPTFDKQAR